MNDKPQNVSQLNKYIKKFWPEIQILKGRGYFYLDSQDDDIALKLSGLYSSTVEGMWPIYAFTYERWKSAIQDTLDDWQRSPSAREPVFESKMKLRNLLEQIKIGK